MSAAAPRRGADARKNVVSISLDNFRFCGACEVVGTGEILRFDQVRGYGFIAPTGGGADIFLHMNDILDEKSRIVPGTLVEFEVEQGQRGLKASSVRIVRPAGSPTGPPTRKETSANGTGDESERLCDVLSSNEFTHEITELLIESEPTLTAAQISRVRRSLMQVARKYGWVED